MHNKRIRYKSHSLLAYEALFRRLKLQHRNNHKIRTEYLKQRAGFYGEKNLDYKLSLFPQQDFLHFPDLRLHNYRNFFQIDSLVITPKVIFILEAKNLQGVVEYHATSKQFIQTVENRTTSYKDPLLQVETQKRHLSYWLKERLIHIPIENLVVLTNPETIIKNIEADDDFNHRFVTLESLLFKMEEIYQSYTKRIMSEHDVERLFQILEANNEPATGRLCQMYNIQPRHLLEGVYCEECRSGILQKSKRNWVCQNCLAISKKPHERVIFDYFLLWQNYITNSTGRELLQINSRSVIYRLLHAMHLKTSGANRNRKYHAPSLSEYPQYAEPSFMKRSILDE